ncbi:hypothetical protein [Ralstonia pseudosolanacearum]|uniref:hypothetical protein n=1 Tax=Ralstonia pseudosolanacearum TaxID=1310165 RepID=UPI003CED2934
MQLQDALKKVIEAAKTQLEDIKSGIEEKMYAASENDPGSLETAIAAVESALTKDGTLSPALVLVSVTNGTSDTAFEGNVIVETIDFDNLASGDLAPILPMAYRDLVETMFKDAHYKGICYEGENTKLELVYCDADNCQVRETVVLSGVLSQVEIVMLARKLQEGDKIIAHQVGLPTPSLQQRGNGDWPNEKIDHVFTTLEAFEGGAVPHMEDLLTLEPPTHELSIKDLYQSLLDVKGWDVASEWGRLTSLA